MRIRQVMSSLVLSAVTLVFAAGNASAQQATGQKPFQPEVGQAGKDVVWVPTSQTLVDKMLDMAHVMPQDYVMDLGSGDGRTVITAAKRGAIAMGVEYNPEMVALSKKNAQEAGVGAKATFVQADLFKTDLTKASVITMFLLPTINMKLRPTLLDLKPGTRIVSNTFDMEDWQPDESQTVAGECTSWCTALLWIVPAKVEGVWKTPQGDLKLTQSFQVLSGTLGSTPVTGRMRGNEMTLTAGGTTYKGLVDGKMIKGAAGNGAAGSWTATRQ
jgi:hypothetical protein